jgi:hypothetical protein
MSSGVWSDCYEGNQTADVPNVPEVPTVLPVPHCRLNLVKNYIRLILTMTMCSNNANWKSIWQECVSCC